ncbi:hypothetical protein [Phenylobacterium sp.]|uniref:hypothetical protein n=1 Tax=Phenylobacterium sp. TaxID=1871053 RepID=UPI002DEE6ECD|nr:hypothetical protein [Phenylobacterium sp.]
MPAAKRGRRIAAVAASGAVHLLVLTALALHAPTLIIPDEAGGPPEPIIPVLLMPRLPPSAATAGVRPGPIRLHRRQLRVIPPDLPVAPLPAPERPPPPAAAPGPAAPLRPSPLPEGPRQEIQNTLRRSAIGCANPQAAGLTRSEREACEERLGRGVREAPYLPGDAAMSADARSALGKAAAAKEADRRYIEGRAPPGRSERLGGSGEPGKPRGLPN